MARVFMSYRRADGPYGVGWLAERLKALDSITGVQTTFHDSALRAGDDFPNALDAEIASSDLVLAVIGPEWHGDRQGGQPRIRDDDDWVVREIASAFEQGTRVMPVLVDGADHPLASEVHPSIAGIARLHALPFEDGVELDVVVEHVKSHLDEVDRERAKLAGLEQPVEVPRLPHPSRIALWTVCCAAIGTALAGWSGFIRLCPDTGCAISETPAWSWYQVLLLLLGGYMVGIVPIGVVLSRRLIEHARHRWRALLVIAAAYGGLVAILIRATESGHLLLTQSDSMTYAGWRGWSNFTVGALAMLPAAFTIGSPSWSSPRAETHDLAGRVRYLGIARDAERWGAILLAVALSIASAVGASLVAAAVQAREVDGADAFGLIGFTLVLTSILLAAHVLAVSRLSDTQQRLERDLEDLPPRYRQNAVPRLIARSFDEGGWGFRLFLATPAAIAVIGAVVVEGL